MYHIIIEPMEHGLSDYHNHLRLGLLLSMVRVELQVESCYFADKVHDECSTTVLWVSTHSAETMLKLTQLAMKYEQDCVWVFSTDTTGEGLLLEFAGTDSTLPVKALAVDYSAIILDFDAWAYAAALHTHASAPDGTYYKLGDTIISLPDGLEDKASLFLGLDIAWSVQDEEDYYHETD